MWKCLKSCPLELYLYHVYYQFPGERNPAKHRELTSCSRSLLVPPALSLSPAELLSLEMHILQPAGTETQASMAAPSEDAVSLWSTILLPFPNLFSRLFFPHKPRRPFPSRPLTASPSREGARTVQQLPVFLWLTPALLAAPGVPKNHTGGSLTPCLLMV